MGLLDDSFQGAVVIFSHRPFVMGTPGNGTGCPIEKWDNPFCTPETNRVV